jgi:hypothetical protein
VRIREAPATVMLESRSTITAALSLLDLDPFNYLQKAGRPVALADGRVEIDGMIDIILKKGLQPDEIGIKARGRLRDVRSDVLVPGRVLSAPDLAVDVTKNRLRIGGRGRRSRAGAAGCSPARTGRIAHAGRFATAARGNGQAGGEGQSPSTVTEHRRGLVKVLLAIKEQ